MTDFASILSAAQNLPEQDRVRLIQALWDTVPPEAESTFSEDWTREIERRVAELDAGSAPTIPWSEVRDAAIGRLRHGQKN